MKEAEDRSTKRLVDKIIQLDNEQTIVLRVDMFESSDSFVHFLNTMSTYVSPDGVSKAQKTTKLILAKIVPISNYVHLLNAGEELIPEEKLDPEVLMFLYSLRDLYKKILSSIGVRFQWRGSQLYRYDALYKDEFLIKRKIGVSLLSNNSEANTDGESIIRFDLNSIKEKMKQRRGVEDIVLTLLHEMCHTVQFNTMEHNLLFYKTYHNLTTQVSLAELTLYTIERVLCNHIKRDIPLKSTHILRDLSRSAKHKAISQSISSRSQINEIKRLTARPGVHYNSDSLTFELYHELSILLKNTKVSSIQSSTYEKHYYLGITGTENDDVTQNINKLCSNTILDWVLNPSKHNFDLPISIHSYKVPIVTRRQTNSIGQRIKIELFGDINFFHTTDFSFSILCNVQKKSTELIVSSHSFFTEINGQRSGLDLFMHKKKSLYDPYCFQDHLIFYYESVDNTDRISREVISDKRFKGGKFRKQRKH